ncbi:MAG: hypothetical protein EB127_10590 [Alphaproteobacteria bacterium]|nr:hypothetical protein [Alphaproteobacteria bacterium]
MFAKTENGFRITCENGYSISVQFGLGNYCSNRNGDSDSSADAEIAVLDSNGEFIALSEYDDVVGYQSVADFVRILTMVSSGRVSDLK